VSAWTNVTADQFHDRTRSGLQAEKPGHGRGTWQQAGPVSNGHARSSKPQVNGQVTHPAILDVEEVRSSILLAPTNPKMTSGNAGHQRV
jgi:hypothetical protein